MRFLSSGLAHTDRRSGNHHLYEANYRISSIDDEKTVAEFWSLTPANLRAKPPSVVLEIKRRVDWPDKATLKKMVWQKPLIHAA